MNEAEKKDMENFRKQFEICAKLRQQKLEEYGVDSYKTFGIYTPCIRIYDKISRIKNMLNIHLQTRSGESIKDNLIDITNYALMALIIIDEDYERLSKEVIKEKLPQDLFEGVEDL